MRKHPLAECEIKLTNSDKVAIVDVDDYDKVSARKWYLTEGYAKATDHIDPRWMHSFISGYVETDHDNSNRLDNRKVNLFESTRSSNIQRKPSFGASEYKGVFRNREKWAAQITKDYKVYCLGTFSTEEEAALAYDAAAREKHGDRARTNF